MTDMTVGYGLVALAALAAAGIGARVAHRGPGPLRTVAAMLVAGLTLYFALCLQGRLVMTRWLPVSNVILLGNWTVFGAAALAGMLGAWHPIPPWRRTILGAALAAAALLALLNPMPRNPPPSADHWQDGVCLQSNRASCSACAAATLLAHYGIQTNEAEMMDLCLTGADGTPTLGLYRGLKHKTAGTDYRIDPVWCDLESLLDTQDRPMILLVMLPQGADVDPRYEQQWGWTPGLGHAVVFFGRVSPDRVEIGDPSIGREQWSVKDLRVLWHGEGLRLTGD